MWSSTRASAVAALDRGDVLVGLVSEDRLEAVPVDVGERELRAGVGALAPGDHARALGPAGEIQSVGARWP